MQMFCRQRATLRSAWTPSPVRRFARHRATRTAVIVLALVGAAATVATERALLAQQVAEWQGTVSVAHMSAAVGAGQPLAGAVEMVERPSAMVPPGSMDSLPTAGLAAVDLEAGELLLASRVRADGARLPIGTVAITVELAGTAALVQLGDLVDVWVTDSANFTSVRVAGAVVVLHRSEREVTVAVPADQAGEVAVAATRPLTITLVG